MSFKSWAALVVVGVTAVVACGVESVKAKDYNQSCTKDADCVLVEQLEADGTRCSFSCLKGAINKKDQEKYDTELAEERADCTQIAQPDCLTSQVATCVQQKCSAVDPAAAGSADAGTD